MSSKIEIPGRYAVTVVNALIDQTAKGAPYLALVFETAEGLGITGYLWLDDTKRSEKDNKTSFERTDKALREVFQFNGDYAGVEKFLKGKPASIECAEESYNGKREVKVRFINAPRVEMSDRASFLKRLSAKSASIGATEKTPHKTSTPESEDVPF